MLVVRSDDDVGKIYLRKGIVDFASINDLDEVPPLKSIFRILTWSHGSLRSRPASTSAPMPGEINASVQELLMEGLRQIDELNAIRDRLPDLGAQLYVPRPLEPTLRDLAPLELDIFQLAYNHEHVATILNQSPGDRPRDGQGRPPPDRGRLPAGSSRSSPAGVAGRRASSIAVPPMDDPRAPREEPVFEAHADLDLPGETGRQARIFALWFVCLALAVVVGSAVGAHVALEDEGSLRAERELVALSRGQGAGGAGPGPGPARRCSPGAQRALPPRRGARAGHRRRRDRRTASCASGAAGTARGSRSPAPR